jgi:hypothetical protein
MVHAMQPANHQNRMTILPTEAALRLEGVSGGRVGEREHAIDGRRDTVDGDGAQQRLEHRRVADDAVQAARLHHQRMRRGIALRAGESDQRHLAATGERLVRPPQRAGTADLHHAVGAAAAGDAEHFPLPIGRPRVVDAVGGAQRERPFQLVVARRGDDDARTRGARQLQRHHRHAAGAEHEHGVAGASGRPTPNRACQAVTPAHGRTGGFVEASRAA